MDYIIERADTEQVTKRKQWLLVYGRRKVGKTFLLNNLCSLKNYYTIKKDSSVISPDGTIQLEQFSAEVKKLLSENKTVVVDEFQRLNEGILEELSLMHPKGKLILSGSSLRVVKKVFEPKSPLLGFFTPLKIGFISSSDLIRSIKKELAPETLIELAPFLREPWIIPSYNKEATIDFVYQLITASKYTITALIGEVFTEEERELSKKYEAILSLIGSGIWNTKELTAILYSRKLIPDPSPTHLIQYIKNLEEMELVESIKLHRSKGRYYRLMSPIMNIYFYLESKYDISSRPTSLEEIKPTLQKLIQLEIQNVIADLFAELYSGRKEYYICGDKEVDFVITKRNKTEIIGEVKWKKIEQKDINHFQRNAIELFGKKVLICKNKYATKEDVEIITPQELIAKVKK
ncbi:ATP-binding protein [Candidatus Woesearchaeota archaeon]|nr:ATP-binding protein [Candidatus Woesearchaeota archaeon]